MSIRALRAEAREWAREAEWLDENEVPMLYAIACVCISSALRDRMAHRFFAHLHGQAYEETLAMGRNECVLACLLLEQECLDEASKRSSA